MRRLLYLTIIPVLLTGCSLKQTGNGYYQDDGPHTQPQVDVSNIPNAVPREDPPSASGNRPYKVFGKTYYPATAREHHRERGVASWYGKKFHGRKTSSGEVYDMYAMTAAHRTLLLPSYIRVQNLENGRSVIVRVNDRGPFLHNRIIDLSYAAAAKLGILSTGTGIVEIETVYPEVVADAVSELEELSQTTATDDNQVGQQMTPMYSSLYLQVGAFANLENALLLRGRLEQAQIKPVRIDSGINNERLLYRVRVGPLVDIEESDLVTKQILKYGIYDAHMVVE